MTKPIQLTHANKKQSNEKILKNSLNTIKNLQVNNKVTIQGQYAKATVPLYACNQEFKRKNKKTTTLIWLEEALWKLNN